MKIIKRIIYTLLGLLLTSVVVLVGVILIAEYSGNRFLADSRQTASEVVFTDDDSRLVYDENGNIAELPAGAPTEENSSEAASDTGSGGTAPASFEATDSGNTSDELFIMDKSTAVFHKESCPDNISISEENKTSMTGSREDVMGRGYTPCTTCNP